MLTKKEIIKYDKYKKYVPRSFLLHIANELNITHASKVIIVENSKFLNKSGNNKRPKIINIDELFLDIPNKEIVFIIKRLSIELYTANKKGYTEVNNKDTNSTYVIGKSGIKKTYSGVYDRNKQRSYNKLKEIGEEGIYFLTTKNKNDDTVLYHHFITPVKLINGKGNTIIRSVIKEFINTKTIRNRFYYHEFEYLGKIKEMPPHRHR